MSSQTDYNELLPEIMAIPVEQILAPNMPINVCVQEAEYLYHWSQADQTALTNAGLNPDLIVKLPVCAGACREAQSLWVKERNTRQEAEQAWSELAPVAFGLRDHLMHAFRYAFRKDLGLLTRVDEIALGDSNADMVQDLNDLAVLGKSHLDLVTAIGISAEELDNAASMADSMGSLLGATNGERDSTSEAMVIRDRAFTLLKQVMDEIRNCGKYVFWRNAERLKGYNSDYWKQQKKSTTEKEETPA